MLINKALRKSIDHFIREDDLDRNLVYMTKLPTEVVKCHLKLKSDMVLAGLPFFFEVFNYLEEGVIDYREFVNQYEGKRIRHEDKEIIDFELPFHIALTGERLALNLLHRASSVATSTYRVCSKVVNTDLKVLDTRKTTPGLRFLEKYAVVAGGGFNHRYGQADTWMIKDNHKKIFGGLKEALSFFQSLKGFYQPIVVEIHDLDELKQAIELGVEHVMLDNFSHEDIKTAVTLKKANMTYEVSGGITLETIESYAIEGVDAASMGSLTSYPANVDISLKFEKK